MHKLNLIHPNIQFPLISKFLLTTALILFISFIKLNFPYLITL